MGCRRDRINQSITQSPNRPVNQSTSHGQPMPNYFIVENGQLQSSTRPPVGLMPFTHAGAMLQPALTGALHRSLRAWGDAGYSPGPLTPQSIFVGADGRLAQFVDDNRHPTPLTSVPGAAQDLAAWLVLLDKSLPTEVVVAHAAAVWSRAELATALPFVTPVFLPAALVHYPPENWVRVARALAAVAGGASFVAEAAA